MLELVVNHWRRLTSALITGGLAGYWLTRPQMAPEAVQEARRAAECRFRSIADSHSDALRTAFR